MMLINKILRRITRSINHLYNIIVLTSNKVVLGANSVINGRLIVSCETMNYEHIQRPTISIGENVKINSGRYYNLIGGETRTIFRTIDEGKIIIGNNVAMSNTTIVSLCGIILEDDVMIGGDVRIYDSNFHSLNYEQRMQYPDYHIVSKPVIIKKGVFVGAGSMILKGVTIGEKSIIGAGSVVACDIPAGEIWAGNPCKFIRKV